MGRFAARDAPLAFSVLSGCYCAAFRRGWFVGLGWDSNCDAGWDIMYRPVGAREKDVSTRLMKPTLPVINIKNVLHLVKNWTPTWELDGDVTVFDAGIAQYLLVDGKSHDKFFASLILGKPSLRCKLVNAEPKDVLDEEANNTFSLNANEVPVEDRKKIDFLKSVLCRRGYRFVRE